MTVYMQTSQGSRCVLEMCWATGFRVHFMWPQTIRRQQIASQCWHPSSIAGTFIRPTTLQRGLGPCAGFRSDACELRPAFANPAQGPHSRTWWT